VRQLASIPVAAAIVTPAASSQEPAAAEALRSAPALAELTSRTTASTPARPRACSMEVGKLPEAERPQWAEKVCSAVARLCATLQASAAAAAIRDSGGELAGAAAAEGLRSAPPWLN